MALWFLAIIASATEDTHTYADNEQVTVWTDKVGPYNNPQETYPFFSLSLCEMDQASPMWKDVQHREVTIGESFEGHEFDSSPLIKVYFGRTIENEPICEMTLDREKAEELEHKLRENYWYSLYIDDLPVWTMLGEHTNGFGGIHEVAKKINAAASDEKKDSKEGIHEIVSDHLKKNKDGKFVAQIYTHREFVFKKNKNQIITVAVEPSKPMRIADGAHINFTYSVKWSETDMTFARRFDAYLETQFFEHKVHWFSVINSFMLSLFLIAVVGIILMKTLRNDFSRYALAAQSDEADSLDQANDETGWKQVSGDVFRKPAQLLPFTVLYASGCHMIALVALVLVLCICNSYYSSRGTTEQALVICYIITQIVSGYQGGYLYRLHKGKYWKQAMALQCLFVPGILFVTFCIINTTALMYKSTMSVPFKTVVFVLLLFACVCVPLHTVGTLFGRRSAAAASFPCRVHHLKRPIPQKRKGFHPSMIVIAGLIPFGCVFIEMYFLFTSFWSYNKVYYVYGFLFAILVLLSLILVCVSITCVYILLNSEDYRWTWHSFMCCASTAVYVFIYSVYYYYSSTQMTGFLQFVYYFGSTLQFCVALGLFCGSFGYFGASKFVNLVYSNVKAD